MREDFVIKTQVANVILQLPLPAWDDLTVGQQSQMLEEQRPHLEFSIRPGVDPFRAISVPALGKVVEVGRRVAEEGRLDLLVGLASDFGPTYFPIASGSSLLNLQAWEELWMQRFGEVAGRRERSRRFLELADTKTIVVDHIETLRDFAVEVWRVDLLLSSVLDPLFKSKHLVESKQWFGKGAKLGVGLAELISEMLGVFTTPSAVRFEEGGFTAERVAFGMPGIVALELFSKASGVHGIFRCSICGTPTDRPMGTRSAAVCYSEECGNSYNRRKARQRKARQRARMRNG